MLEVEPGSINVINSSANSLPPSRSSLGFPTEPALGTVWAGRVEAGARAVPGSTSALGWEEEWWKDGSL